MLAYSLKRLIFALPTLLIVATVVFLLMRAIPGDPILVMLGDVEDPSLLAEMRVAYGLDKPVWTQFWLWLWRILQGDFGNSVLNGEPVLRAILHRFPVTAQVVVASTVVSCLIALPAGLIAAYRQNRTVDLAVVTTAIVLVSIPSFWVGLLLILLFGVGLGWLPTYGFVSVAEDFRVGMTYLMLPVAALVMTEVAGITRMMRSSAIEVLRLEYITHANAKGLPESTVLLRHVFPNAFAPTLTVIGLILGQLLGGAAVIETVFTLPGVGRLLVEGIFSRDYPVVQGCLLFVATVYVLINLATDLLYPLFDPRVRL